MVVKKVAEVSFVKMKGTISEHKIAMQICRALDTAANLAVQSSDGGALIDVADKYLSLLHMVAPPPPDFNEGDDPQDDRPFGFIVDNSGLNTEIHPAEMALTEEEYNE